MSLMDDKVNEPVAWRWRWGRIGSNLAWHLSTEKPGPFPEEGYVVEPLYSRAHPADATVFSWLVESFSTQLGKYLSGFEEAYAGVGYAWFPTWTADHTQALRFAREVDATEIARNLPSTSKAKAVEHGGIGRIAAQIAVLEPNIPTAEQLRLVRSIKWTSTDRDNMEFTAHISCYQRDALNAIITLKEKT